MSEQKEKVRFIDGVANATASIKNEAWYIRERLYAVQKRLSTAPDPSTEPCKVSSEPDVATEAIQQNVNSIICAHREINAILDIIEEYV